MKHSTRSEATPEQSLDPSDWTAFRSLSHRMLDVALDHVQGVRDRTVWTQMPDKVKQALAEPLPMDAQGTEKVCDDLIEMVLPYTMGNTHPHFLSWVLGSGTPGGVIAETFAAAMNANLGGGDHGAIYVERQVIDWCRRVFDFPETASGLVVTGTSMATLTALTVARYDKAGYDVRPRGLQSQEGLLVGYASVEAHSCNTRAFDILGLGQDALRAIPVDGAYKMDIDALRQAIAEDVAAGNRPFCVIGTAGTVNTGAIDDLAAIAGICRDHDLWFHVDGAFGALAALSDALRPRLEGIEQADSLAFDFHKWMHIQYDAGFVLVRDEELHREAFTLRPEYLGAASRGLAAGGQWFCEYGPEYSRGFRALKVWFTLKEHGFNRIAEKIDDNCRQAAYLAKLVEAHPELELVARVSLNIVCFRFVAPSTTDQELDRINAEIVMDLQEKGIAAPSTTLLRDILAIRVSITNHRSTQADFDMLADAVVEAGRAKLI